VDKLKVRIQILMSGGYVGRLARHQEIDQVLQEMEEEFEDLRDLLLVSVCD
jgi:predicted methyltransferase MtxX (methanogen marker protein 4)